MNSRQSTRVEVVLAPLLMVLVLVLLPVARGAGAADGAPLVDAKDVRTTTPLMDGWRFVLDDALTDDAALGATGEGWEAVRLPHTWNAKDAASTNATKPYRRGLGWYRLEFDAPPAGARRWLEFGAASIVADVWLNGQKLGQHKGAFTAFRFDVTNLLSRSKNVLLVKADSRAPAADTDRTAIIPLSGDFNMSGGLYRHVVLISTADPVHIDLGDMGASGVYATTTSVAGDRATVQVRAKVTSGTKQSGEYVVRASLLDASGAVAATAQKSVTMNGRGDAEVAQDLDVAKVHLWQGVDDPYLYKLVVDLLRAGNGGATGPIDKVVQDFGVRQMRFDPKEGFFLNGKHVRLHGVAIHQDYLGKGWAQTDRDMDESLALVKEIGANAIRLGHYPFARHMLEGVDRLGLVAWSEVPYGITSTTELLPLAQGVTEVRCPTRQPTEELRANARQQLRELVRQQYNHASIGMWSVGNEITFMNKNCPGVWYDNVTPLLRELHALAKEEDPSRVTTHAEFSEEITDSDRFIHTGGITDIFATNRYYLWYNFPFSELDTLLEALHARYPDHPLGVSEYGAGAAVTHHTDNVLGGPPESNDTGQPVAYQPEEYAGYFHEQNYGLLVTKKYLWGTFVWNLFDFATGIRNEGDTRGVNTKGLVTFDRKTRKDPFFFYKANWSRGPVTYVTGRRYTERAYAVADVKVYSNADSVKLTVNGEPAGEMAKDQATLCTYVFRNVKLSPGLNKVVATGDHAGKPVADSVEWSLDTDGGVNIAAGQLATGLRSAAGARFGSDNFFTGGTGDWIIERNTKGVTDKTAVSGTPDAHLFNNFRRGTFRYEIPLADGNYVVTLGFLEPNSSTRPGERVFDVVANGAPKVRDLDVLHAAGAYRTVVTKSFPVEVSGGHLKLEFAPTRGEAVVSTIAVKRP
jgi:beta-galactosidase